MLMRKDPWKLVAPGWQWPAGSNGRATRPVIQKYDTSEPVKALFADPKDYLPFDDTDRVYHPVSLPKPPPLLASPATSITPYWPMQKQKYDNMGTPLPREYKEARRSRITYVKTDVRKLFLDTHQRFYLVVVEAHCDVAGFPRIDPEDTICEAGFVVRRHRFDVPLEALAEGNDLVKDFTINKGQLERLKAFAFDQDLLDKVKTFQSAYNSIAASSLDPQTKANALKQHQKNNGALFEALVKAEDDYVKSQLALVEWAKLWNVSPRLDGWIPTGARTGSWQAINPNTPPLQSNSPLLAETVYPLYRLIPDPKDEDHAAVGRTVYFGLIPTGGDELDPNSANAPRFDDRSIYQIQCFVRRHKPECSFQDQAGDCRGELIWSLPTETYRLANQQDLDGWANAPVTVQLPDLKALEAVAMAGPIKGGMTMKAPPKSALEVDVKVTAAGAPEIKAKPILPDAPSCTFAIPLIDMVAMFLINIFLPILVYLFSLWFMLQLKFCVPGPDTIDLALTAALEGIDDTFSDGVATDLKAEVSPS